MRWMLLGVAICGFASLWGVAPGYALFAAFLVMFANFATFCLLFERPNERARFRVAEELRRLPANIDMAQRLETAPITLTAADRQLEFGPMTLVNLATGIAAIGLLICGIVLRIF